MRRRSPSQVTGDGPVKQQSEEGAVVELGMARACPSCGTDVAASESFCTNCGSSLKVEPRRGSKKTAKTAGGSDEGSAPSDTPVTGAAAPSATEAVTRVSSGRHSRARLLVVSGLGALAVVGVVVALVLVALAWRSEKSNRREAQRVLAATRVDLAGKRHELAVTTSHLAATRKRLARAQALTKRQAAILSQAAVVLGQVDPLLSGVDHLQQITSDIESQRDTFVSDSAQMTSDLLTLENYIANTDPAFADISYEDGLVTQVNAELNNVRAEADSLTSSDSDYTTASDSFGSQADRFTTAVRLLQRQLRTLPKPAR
jgi:hypothetical protein